MRAITTVALLALFAVSAFASVRVGEKQSPWKIIEAWTKQMPAGAAMQINPAFNALRSIYFTTSADGIVYALNTTDRNILWHRQWDDITFLQAVPELDAIMVGRSGATDLVMASLGTTVWSMMGLVVQPDLSNHGDRNFISFGDASNLTLVYRETGLGYTRVCALNALNGNRTWCDPTYRTSGLPDAAFNDTLTAPLFDSQGNQYAGNFNAFTGTMNWVAPVQAVLTGNPWFVAVTNSTNLNTLDSMTGNVIGSAPFAGAPASTTTAVFVHQHILAVCDGQNYIAAINANSGSMMWNVSTPVQRGTMQLQRRGDGVLVLAVLTNKHTNFTRFDAYEGNFMWTVSARPTGTSLAPVHAWLGNDIIYLRDVTNTWSAYGVDTGDLISTGSGDLFLPRSVAADVSEPHVGYFVTGPEGIVYDLKIVPRN